jgi:hypothetical protein
MQPELKRQRGASSACAAQTRPLQVERRELHFRKVKAPHDGIRTHQQRAGDHSKGRPRAPRIEALAISSNSSMHLDGSVILLPKRPASILRGMVKSQPRPVAALVEIEKLWGASPVGLQTVSSTPLWHSSRHMRSRHAMEGPLVRAVDTNVLVYAADIDSQFHAPCRDWLERQRARPDAWYPTWPIPTSFYA